MSGIFETVSDVFDSLKGNEDTCLGDVVSGNLDAPWLVGLTGSLYGDDEDGKRD